MSGDHYGGRGPEHRARMWPVPLELTFVECDTCAAQPGTPPLCQGCLRNRAVIEALLHSTTSRDQAVARAKAEAILWPGR